MKISDFECLAPFIVRDGEFFSLGSTDLPIRGLLVYADSLKYIKLAARNPGVSCIITSAGISSAVPLTCGLVIFAHPRSLFYDLHEQFVRDGRYALPFEPYISRDAKVHHTAQVEPGCRVDSGVTIAEHVVIRAPVWIGRNVTIDSGVKIGVDGILFRSTNIGPKLIPHGGYVRIHDDATLMANSIIVRSVHDTDPTVVGNSALVGLGAIIGHDAKVGMGAIVSNQCVVARASKIGARAFLGTHCMIREHVTIGDEARVMAGSVVISNVPGLSTVSGNFAFDHNSRLLAEARANARGSL